MKVSTTLGIIKQLPRQIVIVILYGYRYFVSPLLGPRCRFYPSCSEYAQIALYRYGFIQGSWLVVKRLCRCHPFHPGGFDPVPEEKKNYESN